MTLSHEFAPKSTRRRSNPRRRGRDRSRNPLCLAGGATVLHGGRRIVGWVRPAPMPIVEFRRPTRGSL